MAPQVPAADEPLRLARHVIIGLAVAVVAPFTLLAWPFALLTGIVIGRADVDRARGIPAGTGRQLAQVAEVTGGVLAMLFVGALIGGLIALLVVGLAVLSEHAAANAAPVDRVIARIVLFLAPILGWIVLIVLGVNVQVRLGL